MPLSTIDCACELAAHIEHVACEAGRAGTPPYHRMRCLSARDRILESI